MSNKVVDKDNGYDEFLRDLGDLDGRYVVVGVPEGVHASDEDDDGDVPTMAQVAFWNEFGTEDGHVPERSFLRSTVDERAQTYGTLSKRLLGAVLDGRTDAETALGLLGRQAQSDVQRKIRSGIEPENAPATIARKGSSKTLIDSGALVQSISYEVRDDSRG